MNQPAGETTKLAATLRKIAQEIRQHGVESSVQSTEKKAALATALLGMELLARRMS